MSTVDGTTNVRIVSFLRACDCQAFGIKIDVSSSWCVSFTNLLSELNRKWKDMFPNHANVYFIYDVDGNLVNTLDQLKDGTNYLCVPFPLARITFAHLWEKWSSVEYEGTSPTICEESEPQTKLHLENVHDNYAADANEHQVNGNIELNTDAEFSSEILENYTIGRKLGEGAFGNVHEATQKSTGARVAIKLINDLTENGKTSHGQREAMLMNICNHRNIVKLLELFETPTHWCLVMELFEQGDLFTWIDTAGHIEEPMAQVLMKDLASAVVYLHSLDITHRDIKPENAFLTSHPNGRISLKIGDFGEAVQVTEPLYEFTGTILYMAPEMWLEVGYGTKIDVWAMGIVVFLILSGYMPFEGKDDHENMFLIVKGKIDFNHPQWVALNISPLAVKFIKYLLQTNPCMRPSAKKVLRHPWLNTIDPKQSIASSSQNCTTSIMGRS